MQECEKAGGGKASALSLPMYVFEEAQQLESKSALW